MSTLTPPSTAAKAKSANVDLGSVGKMRPSGLHPHAPEPTLKLHICTVEPLKFDLPAAMSAPDKKHIARTMESAQDFLDIIKKLKGEVKAHIAALDRLYNVPTGSQSASDAIPDLLNSVDSTIKKVNMDILGMEDEFAELRKEIAAYLE